MAKYRRTTSDAASDAFSESDGGAVVVVVVVGEVEVNEVDGEGDGLPPSELAHAVTPASSSAAVASARTPLEIVIAPDLPSSASHLVKDADDALPTDQQGRHHVLLSHQMRSVRNGHFPSLPHSEGAQRSPPVDKPALIKACGRSVSRMPDTSCSARLVRWEPGTSSL